MLFYLLLPLSSTPSQHLSFIFRHPPSPSKYQVPSSHPYCNYFQDEWRGGVICVAQEVRTHGELPNSSPYYELGEEVAQLYFSLTNDLLMGL